MSDNKILKNGKKVVVAIAGVQFAVDDNEAIQVVSEGICNKIGDKTYIRYHEKKEDGEGAQCMLKLSDGMLEIVKKGSYASTLIFKENETTKTIYSTPYGRMTVAVKTTELRVLETDNIIDITVRYDLFINEGFVSDCDVRIKIKSSQ